MFCKIESMLVYLNDLLTVKMQLVLFPSVCSTCSMWDKAENVCAIHITAHNIWDLCGPAGNTYEILVLFRDALQKSLYNAFGLNVLLSVCNHRTQYFCKSCSNMNELANNQI